MTIKRQQVGKWLLDFCPEGKPKGKPAKRIRKTFSTKGEAIAYETHIMENVHTKPWLDGKEDRRKLRDLVNQWFDEHGVTLDDGVKRKVQWSLPVKAWVIQWHMSLTPPYFPYTAKNVYQARFPRLLASRKYRPEQ